MARGDIVARTIRVGGLRLPAWHYGIEVGDGAVVHLQRDGVHRSSAREFADGGRVIVVARAADPDAAVARAMASVGERRVFSLWSANCADFVTWTCRGKDQRNGTRVRFRSV